MTIDAVKNHFFDRVFSDSASSLLVRRLLAACETAISNGIIADTNLYSFHSILENFATDATKPARSATSRGDITHNHYDNELDSKRMESLIVRPAHGDIVNDVLIASISTSLSTITDKSEFDKNETICKRIRQGLEPGYKRLSLNIENRELVGRFIARNTTISSLCESLIECVSRYPSNSQIKGLLEPTVAILQRCPALSYRKLTDADYSITELPKHASPLKPAGFVFSVPVRGSDESTSIDEEISYISTHFFELDDEYDMGADTEEESNGAWQENFSNATTDSLEQSSHEATTMDNRLLNPPTRINLDRERQITYSLLRDTTDEISGEMLRNILTRLAVDLGISLGLTLEEIFEIEIGDSGRILSDGRFHRHVRTPKNIYHADAKIADLCDLTIDHFLIDLCSPTKETVVELYDSYNRPLIIRELFENTDNFKDYVKDYLEQIGDEYCMPTIAVNQLQHQLPDFMAAIGHSMEEINWLAGRSQHRPPTGVHYNNVSVEDTLAEKYASAVKRYFDGEI